LVLLPFHPWFPLAFLLCDIRDLHRYHEEEGFGLLGNDDNDRAWIWNILFPEPFAPFDVHGNNGQINFIREVYCGKYVIEKQMT